MLGAGNGPFPIPLDRLALTSRPDKQFSKLCSLLSTPWATSPLYSTNALRVSNRSTLIPLLIGSLSTKTTAEWLVVMQGNGFPFAPVNDIKGTFAHPQAVDRGVTVEVDHPRAGKIKLLAPAVVYNGEKMKVRPSPHYPFALRQRWTESGN